MRLVDDPEASREGLTLPSDFNSRLSVVEVTGAKRLKHHGDDLPEKTNVAGWKMDPLKMYFLLKMVTFHRYVSLLEGTTFCILEGNSIYIVKVWFLLGDLVLS